MSNAISITKTKNPKIKPDQSNLDFGKIFTDHMFIMDYDESKGWYDPRVVPYAPLELDPSTMVFHYGQAVFEGMKAYKTIANKIVLFRPDKNIHRLNVSNERICIPAIDPEFALEAIKTLVNIDSDWIPVEDDTSLYIRPFIISTDPFLGVRPSSTYKFMVILSPVGSYYTEGLNPVKIFVESKYVRAVKGGIGFAKTTGNYVASLKAQADAKKKGYSQVLWLDGVDRRYVEEVGTMNVFFKIKDEVITPSLEGGSILAGVTRDSTIELLRSWGENVVERKISIDEIYEASVNGTLKEAFGTGTAATIAPIGELLWNERKIIINNSEIGTLSQNIYNTLRDLQCGKIPDTFGWTVEI